MKGQDRVSRGRGFKGVVEYVLDHDEPELIHATVNASSNKSIVRDFVSVANLRRDIKKPVWHNSLRLPEGEHVSNEEWRNIVVDYLNDMGLSDAQVFVVKANLKEGEHVHIIVNRVFEDGSVYHGVDENLISSKIISDLERKYGLTITKPSEYTKEGRFLRNDKTKLKRNEIEQSVRTGEPAIKTVLQELIDDSLADKPDTRDFINRLESAGVKVLPNISASTGRMNGFSFEFNDVAFSGSKLGKKYTWNQLKRAIHYKEEHNDYLIRIKQRKEVTHEQRDNEESTNIEKSYAVDDRRRAEHGLCGLHELDVVQFKTERTQMLLPGDARDSLQPGIKERDRRVRRTIHDEEISSEKTTTSTSKLSKSIESNITEDQDTERAREKTGQTESSTIELSSTHRATSEQIYKSGFVYVSSTAHSDTNTTNNNYSVVKTMKHKKKSFEELNNIDHGISGNTLEAPVGDELVELQKRYLKTLELAFTQSGNQYFYRDTNRLAFYETDTKVVGKSLFGLDGSINKTAVKAMCQASQIKFGNAFTSTGNPEFVREAWFAAAMIGCHDTGFTADSAALDELKFRMMEHKDKYGRDVQLHENIAKLLEQHELDMKNRISPVDSAISGGLFGNTQQQSSSNELKSTVNISSLVDNYKKAQNKESEENNQQKPSIKSLIDNYKKSQP